MKKALRVLILLSILGCVGSVAFLLVTAHKESSTVKETGDGRVSNQTDVASTTQITEGEHPSCQILEGGMVVLEDDIDTYTCDFNLKQTSGVATLEYTTEVIKIKSNGETLATFTCESESGYGFDCYTGGFDMRIIDVTYDGYVDFGVTSSCGAYQCAYSYYAFDSSRNTFVPIEILTDIMEPFADTSLQTISTYSKGRGIGDTFVETTYAFKDGSYELVKQCSRDVVNYMDPETDYVYLCMEKQGTEMATTTYKIITAEEVFE